MPCYGKKILLVKKIDLLAFDTGKWAEAFVQILDLSSF